MQSKKQIWITIVGCVLAAVIICAQLFAYYSPSFQSKSLTKTEQKENSKEENQEAKIVIASYSIPSPVHVQMNLDPHLLFEILFEDDAETKIPALESSSVSQKFLVTLFRVIISPNAP
jgi:hypothetical protein